MKKNIILPLAMSLVLGILPPLTSYQAIVAYAAARSEQEKADFAYEMAKITATIVATTTTDPEKFKVEFAYATAQVTTRVMPLVPSSHRAGFAYEMAKITTKIINDPHLDVQKAKATFAYETARLTSKVITDADIFVAGTSPAAGSDKPSARLRSNDDIEKSPAAPAKPAPTRPAPTQPAPEQPRPGDSNYIAQSTYNQLIDELTHVKQETPVDHKVSFSGEVRFHYANNSGAPAFSRDSSGFRAYLGANAAIDENWRAYGMLEGRIGLTNYDDMLELSKLYVTGTSGDAKIKAGKFGYLMADGYIYDSSYLGVSVSLGDPVEYTLSFGKANETKNTTVATARYKDLDYDLEAGVYHYTTDNNQKNTILTLGGKYHFNDFTAGATYLESSTEASNDNKGYVLSLDFGDLKTWRAGTYELFAKYYNQPRSTFLAHGMNGQGNRMQGFKGYEFGVNYTLAENLMLGIQYFRLKDKTTDESASTLWGQISQYF